MKNQSQLLMIFLIMLSWNCINAQSNVVSHNISTRFLKDSIRTIWVYLPKNYHKTNKKLPVLYMHDAQNIFDKERSFAGLWNVHKTLDSLNQNIIVVGIDHGNHNRLNELTPTKHRKHGGGNANDYLSFVTREVMPFINAQYNTKKSKKNTWMMGSSLGGLVTYYALLKYPKKFGKVGIFSPSFWFFEGQDTFFENTKCIKSDVYLLCGDQESEQMVDDMMLYYHKISSKLSKKNKIKYNVIEGGQHNEKLWEASFGKAIEFFVKN